MTLDLPWRGHDGYYGITSNKRGLARFHQQVERTWKKWLGRRSWHAPRTWPWFREFLARHPLPPVRIVHSALAPRREALA
ncbi:MAG: hypothetical protein HY423_14925 [Candidatus Lambdaproteobacteria bacterium]|nr:hypothetical protein [Candidatus Lambdaproteobacteria bacterium]